MADNYKKRTTNRDKDYKVTEITEKDIIGWIVKNQEITFGQEYLDKNPAELKSWKQDNKLDLAETIATTALKRVKLSVQNEQKDISPNSKIINSDDSSDDSYVGMLRPIVTLGLKETKLNAGTSKTGSPNENALSNKQLQNIRPKQKTVEKLTYEKLQLKENLNADDSLEDSFVRMFTPEVTLGLEETEPNAGTSITGSYNENALTNKPLQNIRYPKRTTDKEKREIKSRQKELLRKMLNGPDDVCFEIKSAGIKGNGLFTTKAFKKEEFVIRYRGNVVSVKKGRELEKTYEDSFGSYMFFTPTFCVDATNTTTYSNYINHSSDYNLKPRYLPDEKMIYFRASRDIEIGEELSYDYNDRRPSVLKTFPWMALPKKKSNCF